MATYRVYMTNTIEHYLDVEVDEDALEFEEDAPDVAIDLAEQEGLPSVILLDHTYPEELGWRAMSAERVN